MTKQAQRSGVMKAAARWETSNDPVQRTTFSLTSIMFSALRTSRPNELRKWDPMDTPGHKRTEEICLKSVHRLGKAPVLPHVLAGAPNVERAKLYPDTYGEHHVP
jgi:hypothetical protein